MSSVDLLARKELTRPSFLNRVVQPTEGGFGVGNRGVCGNRVAEYGCPRKSRANLTALKSLLNLITKLSKININPYLLQIS